MNLSTYIQLDATRMSTLLQHKQVTPRELVQLSFEQLEKVNPTLNGVIHSRKEKVLKEADHIDLSTNPLAGIPMLLKDTVTQGLKEEQSTSGARLLKENKSENESYFVQKLQQAGLLFTGHTTTPEFSLKSITEPELHGPVHNPWNTKHSTGGSSGGAAAMVASGVVPIAGASDGGGSIRVPASFTGIFGLKPTRGRTPVGPGVGRQWHGAAIDFVLGKSVADTALMLDHLQSYQTETAYQTPIYKGSYKAFIQQPLDKQLKIAYRTDSPIGTPVSEEAKLAVENTVHWLKSNGHIVEQQANDLDEIQLTKDFFVVVSTETAILMKQLQKNLGREITSTDVEMETWILNEVGKSNKATDLSMSIASWDHAAAKMETFLHTYDFYITPTTASTAPRIGELTYSRTHLNEFLGKLREVNNDRQHEMLYDLFLPSQTYTCFTQLANITGQPAMSLPLHLAKNGLPIGVQVMAARGREHQLLQLAHVFEDTEQWIDLTNIPILYQ